MNVDLMAREWRISSCPYLKALKGRKIQLK